MDAIKIFLKRFGEAWTACSLAMVQGDLTVFTLGHALTAAKTGSASGLAFVLTASVFRINSVVLAAWIAGILTMLADIMVHPTHFGEAWTEAAVTGLGAAALCFTVERLLK